MKGRLPIEPDAKTGIHQKMAPASSINRSMIRDLRRMIAFTARRSPSATRPDGRAAAGPEEPALSVIVSSGRGDRQPFDDLLVTIKVPLAGEVLLLPSGRRCPKGG